MKKLIFVLALLPAILSAQTNYLFTGPMPMKYGGASITHLFSGDSAKWVNTKSFNAFDKKIKAPLFLQYPSDTLSTKSYARSLVASGGITFIDDILDFQTNKYAPYTSKPTGLGFYTGTTNPDGTTRLNLNGYFQPTQIAAFGGGADFGVAGSASSGIGVSGEASSGKAILGRATTGNPFYGQQSDPSTNYGHMLNLIRTGNITGTVTGNIIQITDNPTVSVANTSKVLSATIGSTERISLNPRVADGSSSVAYVFDTHNVLSTAGAKLASFKNNGTEKLAIDKDGYIKANVPHISLYRNTDLTIAVGSNTWHKLSGFTAKDGMFLTYQGDSVRLDVPGHYFINFNTSFTGLNNEIWELGVFKNNVLEEPSALRYTSTSDVGNMSCPIYLASDGDDWISFRVRNTTDADDPTFKRISIIIAPIHLLL